MKSVIFILAILFSVEASAQTKTLYANSYFNINAFRLGIRNGSTDLFIVLPDSIVSNKMVNRSAATISTTDATPTTIFTIPITDETAGVLEITIVGREAATGGVITGTKFVRFAKDGGTLTLGTPTAVLVDEATGALSTATWAISTSANNVIVQVTGVAATNANWKVSVNKTQY